MTNDFSIPYLPVCICLDTGVATSDDPEKLFRWMLRELKAGFDATLGEPFRPELLLICCGETPPHCPVFFRSVEQLQQLPPLAASSSSLLGEGVNTALDALTERLATYSREGVSSLTPRLILISKGHNDGNPAQLRGAAARVRRLSRCACLHPHIICPGRGENRRNLLLFAPRLPWHRELCRRLYLLCTTCRDTLRHLFHRCTPFHTTPFHTPS